MSCKLNYVVQVNDRAATIEELSPLAFAGHAHMTAMQIHNGQIRGLDLHLARLQEASLALFGKAIPDYIMPTSLNH